MLTRRTALLSTREAINPKDLVGASMSSGGANLSEATRTAALETPVLVQGD